MNYSEKNNDKFNGFDRFSFSTRRDSIRNSLMSRGLSILFRSSIVFTDEEEKDLMGSCQSFIIDEQLTEEMAETPKTFFHQSSLEPQAEPELFEPMLPRSGPTVERITSAPPSFPSNGQPPELDEVSCSSNTSCSSSSEIRQTPCFQSLSMIQEPGPWDIVCGRNSGGFHYVGNRRFRVTVLMNMNRYLEAPTRDHKTKVIQSIVRTLQDDVGARFLRKVNKNQYRVLNDKEVRNKVAHTMRDLVQEHKKNDGDIPLKVCPKLFDRPMQWRRTLQRFASVGY
jgi:hypothetical protein